MAERKQRETKAEKEKRLAEQERYKAEKEKWKAERAQWSNIRKAQASYRSALKTRLSTGWTTGENVTGLKALNRFSQQQMRERAQQVERDYPLVDALLTRATDNIVGSDGFGLQVLSSDPVWNKQVEAWWNDWKDRADFDGRTFTQHLKLVYRQECRDGDIGVGLLKSGQVQIIKGEYIRSAPEAIKGNMHYDGVELDQYGRIKLFWIEEIDQDGEITYRKVNADDLVFIRRVKDSTQLRGVPVFAGVFNLLDQFHGYLDAVCVAQRIAACFGLIITEENPTKSIAGLPYTTNSDGEQQRTMTIEPGVIQKLKVGEEITQIKPEQPSAQFGANLRILLRLIGSCVHMPLELVLLDFSEGSFSSSRGAVKEAQKAFENEQSEFISIYPDRLYRWRISKAIKDGEIPDGPADKFNHRFVGAPWPYLDPVVELQSRMLEVDAGYSTVTEQLLKDGKDISDVIATRAKEIAAYRAANIPLMRSSLSAEVGDSSQPNQAANAAATEKVIRQEGSNNG